MQNHAPLSASKFQNPIYLETPRLRKFYETTLTALDSSSPLLSSSQPLVLYNLLQSDYKCNSLQRMNLSNAKLMKALLDPLAEIELNNSDNKTCIEEEEIVVGLMGIREEIKRKQENKHQQQMKETQQNIKKIFEIYHCGKSAGAANYQNKIKDCNNENEKLEFNDNNDQDLISLEEDQSSELKNEVKKRMRKSNQQLKILKVEFDKNGFWGKDKITQVANITGLSESQVYKWCWDQKKKSGDPECSSITKKIFKSKYKSNKALQLKKQLEEGHNECSLIKNLNMDNQYNEPQTVSKRLQFE